MMKPIRTSRAVSKTRIYEGPDFVGYRINGQVWRIVGNYYKDHVYRNEVTGEEIYLSRGKWYRRIEFGPFATIADAAADDAQALYEAACIEEQERTALDGALVVVDGKRYVKTERGFEPLQ